ncbi:TetR family transcriptional regulator [Streptomyces sp. CA-210063]|uniref:ScbR family autoregulator-binding transcription factor n=1 Tax=Streptomyces sp. CA-210063 TaxID=2801029 RepID=UPI00214AA9C3|nr:ScbR family autoregulator-binding transcription factor [Streptomyces sp. CA-210063]UUU30225.1 TetR family transcriptional regulator [Streptomyces sp. CA-210063]
MRTRHALIRSAAAAFDSRGYAEATLSLISSGAGVSPGALHFHFENKAAVGEAVELEAADTLRAIAHHVSVGRSSALQALIDASHMLAHTLVSDVVVRAGFQLSSETRYATVSSVREAWLHHVRRMLAEAVDEGSLLPGLGLRRATALIVAATTGFEVLGKGDPEWISGHALTDFWETALPCLATAEALRRLDPAGCPHMSDEALGCLRGTRGSPVVCSGSGR